MSQKKDQNTLSMIVDYNLEFIFGKDFSFFVDFDKVRPPIDELTNKLVLNIENIEVVYKRLRKHPILE